MLPNSINLDTFVQWNNIAYTTIYKIVHLNAIYVAIRYFEKTGRINRPGTLISNITKIDITDTSSDRH